MSNQLFLGRFYLPTAYATNAVNVGGNNKSLTAGWKHLYGYTGETASDCILDELEDKIQEVYAGASVSYSTTTGLITIDFDESGTLTWGNTTIRGICGFDDNISGSSDVSAGKPRYTWMPSNAPSYFNGDLASIWTPNTSTVISRCRDGTPYSIQEDVFYDGNLSYKALAHTEVIQSSSVAVYGTFEDFFKDVIAEGQTFRILPDKTSYSDTDSYVTAMMHNDGDSIGSITRYIKRTHNQINNYWNVDIPLWKYNE